MWTHKQPIRSCEGLWHAPCAGWGPALTDTPRRATRARGVRGGRGQPRGRRGARRGRGSRRGYGSRGGSLYDEASGESEAEGVETNSEGLALPEREKIMVESILAWRWPLSEDEKAADQCAFVYSISIGELPRVVPPLCWLSSHCRSRTVDNSVAASAKA